MWGILFVTFPVRSLIALGALALAWNPWGYSVAGVILRANLSDTWPLAAIAGLAVAFLVLLFIRTAIMTLGWLGLVAILGITGLIGWLPFWLGWLAPTPVELLYVGYYFVFSALLGAGMTAGHVKRWLSGVPMVQGVGHHADAAHPHGGS